jgi:hypothetical protein
MGHLFFALLVFGTALPRGQDARLEVRIENVRRSEGQVAFSVVIRNSGSEPLFIEEGSPKGSRDLYAVTIEHATDSKHWEFVGPYRDDKPVGVFRLSPGEHADIRIALPDPYPKIYETPMRKIPLLGRFRASIRYFATEGDWNEFTTKHRRQGAVEVTSPAITIPQKSR